MSRFAVAVKIKRIIEVDADDEDDARDQIMDRICDSDDFADAPLEIVEIDFVEEIESKPEAGAIHIYSPHDCITCPECGCRVEVDDIERDRDEDGPIYLTSCVTHGEFFWQIHEDEEDEEEHL